MCIRYRLSGFLSFFLTLLGFLSCTVAYAGEPPPGTADAPEQAAPAAAPTDAGAGPSDRWRVGFTFYLWFPGVHGITGVNGYDVSFKASARDLLSNLRFGLMGIAQAEYNRWVIFSDLVWVRLEANHQRVLPFPGLPELSAQVKSYELIFNPEFGYRFLDGERVKMDALPFGIRYWHLGSSFQFTPSFAGRTFTPSTNWVDPVMGARILFLLSPKAQITVWGDAGGWGAGAQLDYNIVGAISFKVNPKFSVGAGYRYLYVDYSSGGFLLKSAMSGPVAGLTYSFK
jgi:hypothetical protein